MNKKYQQVLDHLNEKGKTKIDDLRNFLGLSIEQFKQYFIPLHENGYVGYVQTSSKTAYEDMYVQIRPEGIKWLRDLKRDKLLSYQTRFNLIIAIASTIIALGVIFQIGDSIGLNDPYIKGIIFLVTMVILAYIFLKATEVIK